MCTISCLFCCVLLASVSYYRSQHSVNTQTQEHKTHSRRKKKELWNTGCIPESCFPQQPQSMEMSLRRNFEDATVRQKRINLPASAEMSGGNEEPLLFSPSWGKHCSLERSCASSDMTFKKSRGCTSECLAKSWGLPRWQGCSPIRTASVCACHSGWMKAGLHIPAPEHSGR